MDIKYIFCSVFITVKIFKIMPAEDYVMMQQCIGAIFTTWQLLSMCITKLPNKFNKCSINQQRSNEYGQENIFSILSSTQ
jgi:hypothetical protein